MEIDASFVVSGTRVQRMTTSRLSSNPVPTAFEGLDGWSAVSTENPNVGTPSDRDFRSLCSAFRGTGGTARGDDLARLLEDQRCGDFVTLARLIVSNAVFAFQWRNALWVPMFQFELHDLSVQQGPRKVLAELWPAFDGWAMAAWFARPNSWLNDRSPVDTLGSNLTAVLEAARADRFVANG